MKGISQNGKIISLSLCFILLFSIISFSIPESSMTNSLSIDSSIYQKNEKELVENTKSTNVKYVIKENKKND